MSLQMRMADPEVAASTTEFQKVAKAAADIEPTVAAFRAYNEAQLAVQEAREMLRESSGVPCFVAEFARSLVTGLMSSSLMKYPC